MEIPQSIKEHAIKVAKGEDQFNRPKDIKNFLAQSREDILNRFKEYRRVQSEYINARARQEEAIKWCEANGIDLPEEDTERTGVAAGCRPPIKELGES